MYHTEVYFLQVLMFSDKILIVIIVVISIIISSLTVFRLVLKCGDDLVFIFSLLFVFYVDRQVDGDTCASSFIRAS